MVHLITIATLLFSAVVTATQLQPLPPVDWKHTDGAPFRLPTHGTLYVAASAASSRDTDGSTLIPPSALSFAHTFADDLPGKWRVRVVSHPPKSGLYLTASPTPPSWSTYQSGVRTSEGYNLTVTPRLITIAGAGARGMFWGTRTLLQLLALSQHHTLPLGSTIDVPAYSTRGFLLDAGRKWYSAAFLKELCSFASAFKLSEFQYHASDNAPLNRGDNGTWQNVYSHFSLLAERNVELQALVHGNTAQTLNRTEFEDFQKHCADRGVTVIPELESPGHALAITKWKPQLALPKRDLLNLTHPETLPTVKAIWTEFLPWFKTNVVHIGADEYDATLADDYVTFVNALTSFIATTASKSVRIWGTREPSALPLDASITVQHWQYGESDPLLLAASHTPLINSEDWWGYISIKNDHMPILPARYPQWFNTTRTLSFPGARDRQWEPRLVNPFNASDAWQLPADSRENRGAIAAAWNDNGPAASTQLEAYYALRAGLPVAAARMWSGSRGPLLSTSHLSTTVDLLIPAAPAQNLDRVPAAPLPLHWRRGTPLPGGSKGLNYTLTLRHSGPFSLHSSDASLELLGNGTLRFSADGYKYPLREVAEGDGFDSGHPGRIWVNGTSSSHVEVAVPVEGTLVLRSDEVGGTRVWTRGEAGGVGGGKVGEKGETFKGRFEVFVYGGRNTVFSWSQMAFVAPLGSVSGELEGLELVDGI
ncbi:beta-N-hexosaminidase [Geopyxis carbonaria]|nr:beta-N-hexosaminidase [Geopyxis carbonaria]